MEDRCRSSGSNGDISPASLTGMQVILSVGDRLRRFVKSNVWLKIAVFGDDASCSEG